MDPGWEDARGDKMTKPDDDAFPVDYDTADGHGLTKREYLAGMALQGILAGATSGPVAADLIVQGAVICTDALIAALNKVPE